MKLAIRGVVDAVAGIETEDGDAFTSATRQAFHDLGDMGRCGREHVTYEQAALAILVAMVGKPAAQAIPMIDDMGLDHVSASGDHVGQMANMDAEEALEHPMLFNWLDLSAEASVAKLLRAGALRFLLTPGCPALGGFVVERSGSHCWATMEEFFTSSVPSWITARITFGKSLNTNEVGPQHVALTRSTRLSGDALMNIGLAARQNTQNLAAMPAAAVAEAEPAPTAPAGQMMH